MNTTGGRERCLLVWFRSDLRTIDHPALWSACRESPRVAAVFFDCEETWRAHDWGDPRISFTRRCVHALSAELAQLGIELLLHDTRSFRAVPERLARLAADIGAARVLAHEEHEVNEIERDRRAADALRSVGIPLELRSDQCIIPPDAIRTGAGNFYTVCTPFQRAWMRQVRESGIPRLLPRPSRREGPALSSTNPANPVAAGAEDSRRFPAGEREAQKRLKRFIAERLNRYGSDRDCPSVEGTSVLSPYLAMGAISARQCFVAAMEADPRSLDAGRSSGAAVWVRELIWREFFRHVLVGYPRICRGRPFRLETERVRWREDPEGFEAWCTGRTGIPIVDAAMRALLATGWMHNRLRMITASFLTKNLLIDWRRGERFFMNQLIDGDFASNNGSWQWCASTGTDAAPYFRVFNPVAQGKRFDPDGSFVRTWIPGLAAVPDRFVHEPWRVPEGSMPEPIVDLTSSRRRAIEAFASLR